MIRHLDTFYKMKKSLLKTALETIQFQDTRVSRELINLIHDFRNQDLKSKQAQESIYLLKIKESVLDNIGLNLNIIVDTNVLAAVELPLLNLNHIFFSSFIRTFTKDSVTDVQKDFKENESIEIDLKKGKLTGNLSRTKVTMYLSWKHLFNNEDLTDEEIAAIFLHEVGHAFTTFEYINRLATTNQAIATLCNDSLSRDRVKYNITLKEVSQKLFQQPSKLEELREVTDKTVIAGVILSTELKTRKSQIGTPYYDETACEYLADQFVARHRLGKQLITGLEKITPKFSTEKSYLAGVLTNVFHIYLLLATTIFSKVGFSIIGVLFRILFGYLFYTSSKITNKDFTYDNLLVRYKRIKEQMIQDFKNLDHTAEEIINKTRELEEVTKIIENTIEFTPVLTKLVTTLLPGQKRAKNAIQLQRDLEELASNDLFVQSAKLRTLQL